MFLLAPSASAAARNAGRIEGTVGARGSDDAGAASRRARGRGDRASRNAEAPQAVAPARAASARARRRASSSARRSVFARACCVTVAECIGEIPVGAEPRLDQHPVARLHQRLGGVALVHHLEMRRDPGLERKAPQAAIGRRRGSSRSSCRRAHRARGRRARARDASNRSSGACGPSSVCRSLRELAVRRASPSALRRSLRRFAISAAAALVKVRQRMRAGIAAARAAAPARGRSEPWSCRCPAEAADPDRRVARARRRRCAASERATLIRPRLRRATIP